MRMFITLAVAVTVVAGCAQAPATRGQAPVTKKQPAHIKLKLGHYTNGTIGAVIDFTEETENVADVDPVKVRFDGETKIWRLEGQYGSHGRIDYVREGGRVMLHRWEDGRISIYVPDPNGGRSSDELRMYRDADADPL